MSEPQTVHDIRMSIPRNAQGEAWLLLLSDVHFDNPACKRKLLKRHLDQAKERNARVIVVGDFFDLMGGKYDPRRSKSKVRPEYNTDRYLDAVIDDAADFLGPYADNVELISNGNHETAILKNCETDVIQRLVGLLRHQTGADVAAGTYQGWIRLMMTNEKRRQSIRIRYHHGHGGGGVVTKGALWPQRRAAWWPDADIVVSGHIHESWSFPITRERLTEAGRIYNDMQMHLCLGCYKDETSKGNGWAVEKGMPPKPVGGWWLRLYWDRAQERYLYQEMRAA